MNPPEDDETLLPPPIRPMLLQCAGEGCNRWVFSHSRTPIGFGFQGRIFCAEHVPIHE